jgi:glutathione S-transferase
MTSLALPRSFRLRNELRWRKAHTLLRKINALFSHMITQQALSHLSDRTLAEIGLSPMDAAQRAGVPMRLYFAPGACSLAAHIALREAGIPFEMTKIDIASHRTEEGGDYFEINPKGYVPALFLGTGRVLTENTAILSFIAEAAPHLMPDGQYGRARLIEMLAFISAELHKPFIGLMFSKDKGERARLNGVIDRRLHQLEAMAMDAYLLGGHFTPVDAYLLVMVRWARMMDMNVPPGLAAIAQRVEARPTVQAALRAEGLPH